MLQIVESLDVGLYDLTASTGTSATDSITDLDDRSDEALHLDLVVVSADGITDVGFLLVLLTALHPKEGVWELGLVVGYLTYIMEKTCTLSMLGVKA